MRKTARQQQIENLRRQQGNDWFFDKWENDFDRSAKRTFRAMLGVWLLILIANLIIWGVAIWAVVELVQWIKTK